MPKVMLIDDNDNMLSLLDTFLELEGYEVVKIAGDLSLTDVTIHRAIKGERPDLVIMDVYLNQVHGSNGFDLLHRLRKDPDLARTRILISSGMDFSDKCKREGADGFILKPFMPGELLIKIKKIVGP